MEKLSNENKTYFEYIGFTDALTIILIVLILICGVLMSMYSDVKKDVNENIAEEKNWKGLFVKAQSENEILRKQIDEIGASDSLVLTLTDKGLANKVLFQSGSAVITEGYYETLNKAMDTLRVRLKQGSYDFVLVIGHTDADPISVNNSQYSDNWDLGAARAAAVVRYLSDPNKSNHILPTQISCISYGEYKPINSADSEEAKTENRRIEIFLTRKNKYRYKHSK